MSRERKDFPPESSSAPCLLGRETRAESIRGGGGGAREEERDGDRTGESGRRGKEENTKEKAGVGGCEGSLTRLARRPALRCYQPRPQTPIHGHFGGSPQFLGPPTPFTGGPLRATQFFKEHGFLLVQDTSHG